jgi:hypothetical protein
MLFDAILVTGHTELQSTVGLFRVPRGQTNFYSKIYFLSKFQK